MGRMEGMWVLGAVEVLCVSETLKFGGDGFL